MTLPIYIYGQPVLRKVAQDIPTDYPNLKELIQNMYETMEASDGIGLAAPQIGLDIRLLVVDLDVLSETYPEYKGYRRAFINPHIVEIDEQSPTENLEEGCLSLPGIHEKVSRHTRIRMQYVDEELQPHDEWFEGYLSRVLQHEVDHLDGILFTDHLDGILFVDHLSPFRKQLIKNKLKALLQGKFRCGYRTKLATR